MDYKDRKPCPFCGYKDLEFKFNSNREGYDNARITCITCGASKGRASNWGEPTQEVIDKLWEQWNDRK